MHIRKNNLHCIFLKKVMKMEYMSLVVVVPFPMTVIQWALNLSPHTKQS